MECNKEMWICIILDQNTECRTQLCYKPSVVLSQHARICHVRPEEHCTRLEHSCKCRCSDPHMTAEEVLPLIFEG